MERFRLSMVKFISALLTAIPLVSSSALADIHIRLYGQDPADGPKKRVFILNEKTKRITYVDLKRTSEGVYEGKVVVGPVAEGIAEFYRIGEPGLGEKRYFSFSYREEPKDLFIELEPIRMKLEDVKRLSEGKAKSAEAALRLQEEEDKIDALSSATGGILNDVR